jgi:hypothetical protein
LLSRTLEAGAEQEASAGRLDRARTLADEALRWAEAAGDAFTVAMAALGRAMAAQDAEELRERVELAASRLRRTGNVQQLGDLLGAAAYVALQHGSDADAKDYLRRALPLVNRVDDPYVFMLLRGNAGLAELLTGDPEAARAAFRDELELSRELVVLPFASEGLGGLAAVAAVGGDPERAARLSGAAAAHRYGEGADAVDARLESAFLAPARARLGEGAWEAIAAEGAALGFEDAIAYALDESAVSPATP